ncbi:MAG: enoyl-CoA hydratase/isomerase family protein [Halieaceae bacterium]
MSQFTLLEYELLDNVATITLARPEKLNAINPPMVEELHQALDLAEADEQVRAIVLTGAGRAFCAGFDLEVEDPSGENSVGFWREELQRDFDIIMRFWDSPKPTVAAVHSYCLGSGMEMAVACDITVAAEGCRLGAPEVKFGSGIVALILPWLIGPKAAKELLLTGDDRVDAERALALGLVNRVVPLEQLEAEAMRFAREMAGNDLTAVRLTKQAINRSYQIMGMPQALAEALELDAIVESTPTESKQDSP